MSGQQRRKVTIADELHLSGYLVALWPGAWVSQRIGHKKFILASLFLWALLIGLHCTVTTGRQMTALRFFLGMVGHLPQSDKRYRR